MNKLQRYLGVGLLVLLIVTGIASPVKAQSSGPTFREVNITGGEFLMIQNPGADPLELGNYWLGYVSDADSAAGPSERLPAVELEKHQSVILSNESTETCGAAIAGDLPIGLANSGGTLALWRYNANVDPASFSLVESISWSKSGDTDSKHLNLSQEDTVDDYYKNSATTPNTTWLRQLPSQNIQNPSWQVGNLDGCSFTAIQQSSDDDFDTTGYDWPTSKKYPAFTMLPTKYVGSGGRPGPVLPSVDIGLLPPMVNELLPNPAQPRSDAEDEFVELYNPNSRGFDLSGFQIETGSTTSDRRHHFKIPSGTKIGPKSFKVFKSGNTGISLTNGGGQAWLLDPFDKVISKSGVYGEAEDGLAFAMADGKWYWTLLPTPGDPNSIQQSGKVSRSGGGGDSEDAKTGIKGKAIENIKGANTVSSNLVGAGTTGEETPTPIHPGVLAAIALLALAYGLYEYRNDLGNKFYQLKKYRAARRTNRR